ncbi:MAG: alpha/beta hydrolase [Jatrophihabitantaceae bacterium]
MHLPRAAVLALSGPAYRVALNDRWRIGTQRRLAEASTRLNRTPKGTLVQHVRLGDRPAERTTLGPTDRPRAVLYLHGGGYRLGTPRMYRPLAAHLSRAADAVVFNLDYRMAPEDPYPAALHDAVAAFEKLIATGGHFTPTQVAIAGDSAGGGLAVAAARVLTDRGTPPAALALLSPWTDPSDTDMPERDFVINQRWGRTNAASYRGAANPTDTGYAPMHGPLDGLPPMLIHYATNEMLAAQIQRFAARASAAGADVQLVAQPRLWHSAHILAGMLRDATDATAAVGAFLRAHLHD